MFHRVLYNYILVHISHVSWSILRLDTGTYFWCFYIYCTTRYWHIFLMFLRVLYNYILAHISDVSSCTVQLDTVRYFWCFNKCQYLVVQFTMKHQFYVPIYSCTIHDEASEICASMYLYSTRWSIRNMCQHVVVQYRMKHQKYVPVYSCTVHDETSEICVRM
jgi:hypothetical protein